MPESSRNHYRVGTMGFSYADWVGVFYPRRLRNAEHLAHYARHFDCVELDTTFYATPTPDRLKRWFDSVPEHFVFCPKMVRLVTHDQPLDQARGEVQHYLAVMQTLGHKLGPVLLQFGPSFDRQQQDALARVLGDWPPTVRVAVEFRHRSWFEPAAVPQIASMLREHRVCWTAADYVATPDDLHPTTDFRYVRLIGEHQRYEKLNYEHEDMTPALQRWVERLEEVGAGTTAFVFLNNDYSGFSVATAKRLQRLLGLPTRDLVEPEPQGQLFSS